MPHKSPIPDIEIPDVDIWGFLFENKERQYPDNKVLLIDSETERSYTYEQARNTAIDFGKGLRATWEWKKGDVMGLYTPNNIDVPPILWGTHWAGGIVTPANPTYGVEELTYQLKTAEAKALVTQKHCLEVALKACRNVGIPEDRIILLGDERDESRRFKHFTSVRPMSGTQRYRRVKASKPADDLAFIVFSSGTTGLPKGVMLTHRNIVANMLQIDANTGRNFSWNGNPDGKGDRIIAFLPFFHIYGLTCLLHSSIRMGTELHVMAKFDIERFCQIVQSKKITFAFLVPPVVLLLAKHPIVDKYDLSSLRMSNSGAAPLTKEVVDAFWNRLKIPVKQGYGLSETSPTTHEQQWDDWYKRLGSVGWMNPNMVAKYVDEEGNEVAPGKPGELWIKGPNVFKGYLKNPEGTANAITPDGYFKTGDVGYVDEEGNFFITDRVKELIKYKGFQVPPAELEGLLNAHPKIYDVAVIGIYSKDQATELPRAYVVLHPQHKADASVAKEIQEWLAKQVAPHKRLRGGVHFTAQIPKSVTGKILRRILKDQAKKEEEEAPRAKL